MIVKTFLINGVKIKNKENKMITQVTQYVLSKLDGSQYLCFNYKTNSYTFKDDITNAAKAKKKFIPLILADYEKYCKEHEEDCIDVVPHKLVITYDLHSSIENI